MTQNLKHIKVFEEAVLNSNKPSVFTPLFKLKEVAEEAASFDDYRKGIIMIQNHLKNNESQIANALNAIEKLPGLFGNRKYMINVYSLMFPFIERWASDILNKELSNDIELDKDSNIDIKSKDSEDSNLDLDLDLGDIEIDD